MKIISYIGIIGLIFCMSSLGLCNSELSLLSGFFENRSSELQNSDAGGSTEFNLGARYVNLRSNSSAWIAEAAFSLTSYDAATGAADADDDFSFRVGGGYRHIFPSWGNKVRPYLQGRIGIQKVDQGLFDLEDDESPVDSLSIFYAGDIGLNIYVSNMFFFLVEAPLFSSTLYGKTEIGALETTTFSAQMDMRASLGSTRVGLGLRF